MVNEIGGRSVFINWVWVVVVLVVKQCSAVLFVATQQSIGQLFTTQFESYKRRIEHSSLGMWLNGNCWFTKELLNARNLLSCPSDWNSDGRKERWFVSKYLIFYNFFFFDLSLTKRKQTNKNIKLTIESISKVFQFDLE